MKKQFQKLRDRFSRSRSRSRSRSPIPPAAASAPDPPVHNSSLTPSYLTSSGRLSPVPPPQIGASAIQKPLPDLPGNNGRDEESRLERVTESKTFRSMKTLLRLVTAAGDAEPTGALKIVSGGLSILVEQAEKTVQTNADRKAFMKSLQSAVDNLEHYSRDVTSGSLGEHMKTLQETLKNKIRQLMDELERPWWKHFLAAGEEAEDMKSLQQMVRDMYQVFMMELAIQIAINIENGIETNREIKAYLEENLRDLKTGFEEVAREIKGIKLEMLKACTNQLTGCLAPSEKAEYNAMTRALRRACTEGTRQEILEKLIAWAEGDTDHPIFWMNGMAGTGKTTIAYSFCQQLLEKQMLGASFFSSRSEGETADPGHVLPTIAYQLARHSPEFSAALQKSLKAEEDSGCTPSESQFRKLILSPARTLRSAFGQKHLVVVFDGLDECRDLSQISKILSLLIQHAVDLPIKFYISSRPEADITARFTSANSKHHKKFLLHNVEEHFLRRDLGLFLHHRFTKIRNEKSISEEGWPSEDQLNQLLDLSGRLFIYAATACLFIADPRIQSLGSTQKALRDILSYSASNPTPGNEASYRELDALYCIVLSSALHNDEENEVLKNVLHLITTAQTPLSQTAIAELLQINISSILLERTLSSLQSVISVPANHSQPIQIFHASFPDFLSDPIRSKEYHHAPKESHSILANKCLEYLKGHLVQNICGLQDKNVHVSQATIAGNISEALQYACMYWITHYLEASDKDTLHELMNKFFKKWVLQWTECMSLLGRLDIVVKMLRNLERAQFVDAKIRQLAGDTRRCVLQCFNTIRDHPLEIYYSALFWLPKKSIIREFYPQEIPWKLLGGVGNVWECYDHVIQAKGSIYCIALSADGQQVVSGSSDETIRIWNVETGEEEKKLEGHSHLVTSVAFSADGQRVVSGSSDLTIRIWNVETGEEEKKLEGHSHSVTSVAFSADGQRVVSGSDDKTIRIWNVETGEEEKKLEGHSHWVRSVAFSADGQRVVSGSSDKTIRIWNVETGEEEKKLEGHSHWVRSVAFSADGQRVVSGSSDKTIRIWNVETGEEEKKLEGHSDWVTSVAFSADGQRVVSGSDDKTIRIWNVETGEEEKKLEGHSDWVTSVAFSADGQRVVSGSSDKTIRIWNVETGEEEKKLEGHSHSVRSVAFSADGQRVVSGSSDSTIRIWNVETGEEEKKLEGHSDWVTSVAFSADGQQVVSGSSDKTIRIWNVETGEEEKKLEGHSHWVRSVAFSADGQRVVSGSDDRTIRIWNVETGEEEKKLEGRSDSVRSVAFSADGQRVVSGSSDSTIRIWNVETGEEEKKLEGHSDWVTSVAFSADGQQVVSGSSDKTIRIWNVETGEEEKKLEGHSHWVRSVAFSADGQRVVSGSDDKTIRIWNVGTGEEEKKLDQHSQSAANEQKIATDVSHYLHDQWIHHPFIGELDCVYLPFTDIFCSAIHDDIRLLCLGFQSGKVLILKAL
ncbi:hypothetical protein D9758_017931 [Tetrapyrgos nigripes]|uniref:Nephrocystin 3-like N-terminal domain-containing protein n=1 Tax=Tetrapyrgos nigripes TaxID=182062 RepID=A0A8H5C369_9AGAR|nr:hypothetical protein D9758_017931 [Tetrapyrgos nigripes]